MSERLIIPGGLRDLAGREAPDLTAQLSATDRALVEQMRAVEAPPSETTAAIQPGGRNGPMFTLNNEFDQVVCGLVAPRTYLFTNPTQFQFDAFKVIRELLLSPEGQRFVHARGWDLWVPGP